MISSVMNCAAFYIAEFPEARVAGVFFVTLSSSLFSTTVVSRRLLLPSQNIMSKRRFVDCDTSGFRFQVSGFSRQNNIG
jgi:hypothetical protein